jgi:hypothetical protein
VLISCHQNYNINTGDKLFENVKQLKYLEMAAENQNYANNEVKIKLNLNYACSH